MGNERSIREYLGDQRTLMELEGTGFVPGELFYTQLLKKGYETFEQVTKAIRRGELLEEVFENGFYCNSSTVKMLIDSSKGTKLEETAKRMIEVREGEREIIAEIRDASAAVGYSLEDQEEDKRRGMKQSDVEEKLQRYASIARIIGAQT